LNATTMIGAPVIDVTEIGIDSEPNLLFCLPATVIEVFPRTKAGFDCAIAYDLDAVRERLGLAADDPAWQAELDRHEADGKFVVEAAIENLRFKL
jgi:hypothetical protein